MSVSVSADIFLQRTFRPNNGSGSRGLERRAGTWKRVEQSGSDKRKETQKDTHTKQAALSLTPARAPMTELPKRREIHILLVCASACTAFCHMRARRGQQRLQKERHPPGCRLRASLLVKEAGGEYVSTDPHDNNAHPFRYSSAALEDQGGGRGRGRKKKAITTPAGEKRVKGSKMGTSPQGVSSILTDAGARQQGA